MKKKRCMEVIVAGLVSMVLLSACSVKDVKEATKGFRIPSLAQKSTITMDDDAKSGGIKSCDAALTEDGKGMVLLSNKAGGYIRGYTYRQPLWVCDCNEYISLRSKDRTSADVFAKVPLYAKVTYLGTADNGFLYVDYNGIKGYALEKYLSEYENLLAINEYMNVAYCKESITFRKEPSKKADEICQIPKGATVWVMKYADEGFYMIQYKEEVGYALAHYLIGIDDAPGDPSSATSTKYCYGQPMKVVNCKEYISLRSEASTSADVLKKIPLNGVVIYQYEASNGFAYVNYKLTNGSTKGYVLQEYLEEYKP